MIIITDSHVSKSNGNHAIFFNMLESFEKNNEDIIFLGDIFDLWIAMPQYEEDIHREFTSWCHRQKKYRVIGYMEGNHEFYLADERSQAFTWCSKDAWWRDSAGVMFVHGDQINRKDRNYLSFRKLVKNSVTKFIIHRLPSAPKFMDFIKEASKKTNLKFRTRLPKQEIEFFAESRFAENAEIIFVGHFHQEYIYHNHDGNKLYLLPDWLSTQKVALYRRSQKQVRFIHWREISL
jgi:UDP-2,3-diacylglucosamine pyrophosphatase LpxH